MPFTTNIGCICGTLFLRVKGACRVLPLSGGTATLFVEHIAPSHTILCYWHLVHKTHRSVISTLFSSFFLLISMIGLKYTVFVSVFFFFLLLTSRYRWLPLFTPSCSSHFHTCELPLPTVSLRRCFLGYEAPPSVAYLPPPRSFAKRMPTYI
jgi:hypothetical protein